MTAYPPDPLAVVRRASLLRLATFASLALFAAPAPAADRADVMAVVRQLTRAFNRGDVQSWAAGCVDPMTIIDELAPHEWHGRGAAARWFADFEGDARRHGITGATVTIGEPRHVDVAGARAYVVVPAGYSFLRNGGTVRETGSIWTFAMRKVDGRWRVAAWAWAKN